MPHAFSANVFPLLAVAVVAFQVAVVGGAPYGALPQRSRNDAC